MAGLGLVTAAAVGSAAKLGTDKPLQFAADITAAAAAGGVSDAWLTNLAEVVTKSHNAIETLAVQGSYLLLQASGGTPKDPPSEAVASLLSTGLF